MSVLSDWLAGMGIPLWVPVVIIIVVIIVIILAFILKGYFAEMKKK